MRSDDTPAIQPGPEPPDPAAASAGTGRTDRRAPVTAADVKRVLARLREPGGSTPGQPPPTLPAVDSLLARLATWRRRRLGLRGVLLYVLPLPLSLASLVFLASGDFGSAVASAAAFAALIGGAYLNRRGLREQLLAPQRRYSRPATTPYGYLAAASVAVGTAIAASGVVGHGVLVGATFALLAAVGLHLTYPLPPPRTLLARPAPAAADDRLASALERAEGRVLAIEVAADGIGNQELEERLRRIAGQGRGILELVADRPTELFRARKFLNVHLEGAERVASRYVQTHRLSRSRALESNFRNVLADIEAVFERQRTQLLEHDVDDLDVQIEVLRKQLEREGLS